MCERVALLFCEGIDRLDAGQFGGGKLSEPLFGFDGLLVYYLKCLPCGAFAHRHRFGGIESFRNRLHSNSYERFNSNHKPHSILNHPFVTIVALRSIFLSLTDRFFF